MAKGCNPIGLVLAPFPLPRFVPCSEQRACYPRCSSMLMTSAALLRAACASNVG